MLDELWAAGKQNACTPQIRNEFSEVKLAELKSKSKGSDREVLKAHLTPFLHSFGLSHNEFISDQDESFYHFKSYWAKVHPQGPAVPPIVNPGVQVGLDADGYFIREVLHGSLAKSQGLQKGDRLFSLDGRPFKGDFGNRAQTSLLEYGRHGMRQKISLKL